VLPAEQVEFFEAKIRPILVESCYPCHSVQAGKSKADLFVDSRDALRKGGASGAAVIAGEPEKSLLIRAIRYQDDDLQMPPPDDGGKLSADKIELLETWVKMGAPDPRVGGKPHPMDMAAAREHWAFQPVKKPAVPPLPARLDYSAAASKGARVVDAFVRAELVSRGLSPAPAADKRTLLRRVTYDLTGLPPTPEEMDAFLADTTADAYPRVVERLLASPRYGERWGRFWLDVARFADTKGYLAGDVERRFAFSHTYRDYVIRAFNEDKPFDRFIVEQIAADHLPLGDDKSALAGLGFLTLGRRFLNNQNDIIDDRIDVVTRGLMGLTVACARCHDHKFDPIPTKDYYALHGVFASSEEPTEKPLLAPLSDSPAYQEFLRKSAEIEAKIKAREVEEVQKFLAGIRVKTGDYLLAAHDAASLKPEEKLENFAGTRKLNVDVLRRWRAVLGEPKHAADPVLMPWLTLVAEMQDARGDEKAFAARAAAFIARAQAEFAGGADGASVNPRVLEALANGGKPLAALKDVAEAYNRVFGDLETTLGSDNSGAEEDANSGGAKTAEVSDAKEAAKAQLRRWVLEKDAPAYVSYTGAAEMIRREINNKTAKLKRELEALNWTEAGAPLRAMALVDKPKPANSKVFLRGNPANRGAEVPRQFLEVLEGSARAPFSRGSGRLELAEKIASAANPLTARVFVNRIWGWHFGAGLVRTPSDFGVRTEPPVHRELLDWLAASFMESGWSVKALHRWIVLSQTYQQASGANASAATADPDNHLVHSFTRRRLEFEALRDTLLAVSGSLDLTVGGLPDDLTKEPFTVRRTVYGFIDRQNLPGMFRTFDFPNPDVSSAQRFATTVPQQALFLMNSPFTQEQARRLAGRPEVQAARRISDAAAITALYRAVHQRAPEADEAELAAAFLARETTAKPAVLHAGWRYGYGEYDRVTERVSRFVTMTVRKDGRVAPTEAFPDPALGRVSLTSAGGHAGKTAAQAAIRRWTAPADGLIRIEGTLGHTNANGDGVRGRIVSDARGLLGEWIAHNTKADTPLREVAVRAGETVDFVVDCRENANADAFTWAPTVAFTPVADAVEVSGRTWSARKDFDLPEKPVQPLERWEALAQVLLLSNELAFVD
jgi:hypothetical protein